MQCFFPLPTGISSWSFIDAITKYELFESISSEVVHFTNKSFKIKTISPKVLWGTNHKNTRNPK